MVNAQTDQESMARLLAGLLVGAEQPMTSVGHWAERLLDDPPSRLAIRFLDQLNDEWLDAEPPDCVCERIAGIAQRHMMGQHPGWPHLWGHTLRVTGTALDLAREEGVDPAVAYLLGVLHDVAKLKEGTHAASHEALGARFAGRILADRLPARDVEQIQAAILKEGDGALSRILHDADKLDKIGASGVLRRVSTGTDRSWALPALDRVADDREHFPAMRTARGRDMAEGKLAFLDWFLTEAQETAAAWA